MVGAELKGKKLKVGEEEEDNNHIDEGLVLSIEKLQEIQDELEKINEDASEKVLEVEQKYSEIRKPVYDRRNDIIKSIPDFWLTAFCSHPALSSLLNPEENKVFKYFSSLEVEDYKDLKSGYSISFYFQPNPYFEETKITKTFTYLEDEATEIKNTPITWKEGMGLPNGVSHEKKGNKRLLELTGFFSWFTSNQMDEMPDEVAEIIKEDLWPNPLSYFNNDPEDGEDFDGIEVKDRDKDEDDSEEEDDDEDEDEEEEEEEEDGDDEE